MTTPKYKNKKTGEKVCIYTDRVLTSNPPQYLCINSLGKGYYIYCNELDLDYEKLPFDEPAPHFGQGNAIISSSNDFTIPTTVTIKAPEKGLAQMSLREYYAGLAMQGLIQKGYREYQLTEMPKDSVDIADTLIKELEKVRSEG